MPFVCAIGLYVLTMLTVRGYDKKIRLNKRKELVDKIVELDKGPNAKLNKIRDMSTEKNIYTVHKPTSRRIKPSPTDTGSSWSNKKKSILMQFKYKSDVRKTVTFLLITISSYVLIVPVFVLHFYRTKNSTNGNYDDGSLIDWRLYTSFAWLSYLTLLVKSLLCFATNSFYRDAFYQAVNIRGFRGQLHYKTDKNHKNVIQSYVENGIGDDDEIWSTNAIQKDKQKPSFPWIITQVFTCTKSCVYRMDIVLAE